MAEIDSFAVQLFEEAKGFLEKAKIASEPEPFCHASLLLGISSLEAHLNAIADELSVASELSVLDKSILLEREYGLDAGAFQLKSGLKIYRMEDRLKFLFVRFTKTGNPTGSTWWAGVASAVNLRNKLVHPRSPAQIGVSSVEQALTSILECLNALYKALYKKSYPRYNRGLQSLMDF